MTKLKISKKKNEEILGEDMPVVEIPVVEETPVIEEAPVIEASQDFGLGEIGGKKIVSSININDKEKRVIDIDNTTFIVPIE
jgi:hypothetical protein